ncbi:cornichon [Atractiella rhizophila]|nr:cornichon [Atractiella rhizophila]
MLEAQPSQEQGDRFFATYRPPQKLKDELEAVKEFVGWNVRQGKRIVLVTSGGTTVPLEKNVVRFLDNFSAGTRGSASAEHFLRTGAYAVVFMHRQFSLRPFERHLGNIMNLPGGTGIGTGSYMGGWLDLLELEGSDARYMPKIGGAATMTSDVKAPSTQSVHLKRDKLDVILPILQCHHTAKSKNLLHLLTFTTVYEYLYLLRGVSQIMGSQEGLGRKGMFYLAAAVSDFWLDDANISEHKIQSGQTSRLNIEMEQVPKVLRPLVQEWTSEGFIVSFKLETDQSILLSKARASLERYGHQVVIANELHNRKTEVTFVESARAEKLVLGKEEEDAGIEIEEKIVGKLMEMHGAWIG